MNKYEFEISIPTDNDGFVLMQCEHCGTFFKLRPADIEDEGILHIYCPSCGLISENYLTEDAIELAINMAENAVMDMIYDTFKDLERKNSHGLIQIKTSSRPKHKDENPIRSGIEAMEEHVYPCCQRSAKIKPILKMMGSYCPFCGVINYGTDN